MTKRNMILLAVGIGLVQIIRRKKKLFKNESIDNYIKRAGIPEQIENPENQIENTKMLAEGSQYGVHYYNEIQSSKG